jgi:hypothetical protein
MNCRIAAGRGGAETSEMALIWPDGLKKWQIEGECHTVPRVEDVNSRQVGEQL